MLRCSVGSAALILTAVVVPLFVRPDMLCHASLARGAGPAAAAMDGTRQHTRQPIVTGTSVLGIKYK